MINPRLLTSRARQKTCPFINNFETASTNVIYFITWSQFKNLYFSERKATGRILREHHRVVGMTNTHLKQSSDTNHCKLHALKQTNKKVSFKLALLTPPPPPFIAVQCWGSSLIFQRLAKNDNNYNSAGFTMPVVTKVEISLARSLNRIL